LREKEEKRRRAQPTRRRKKRRKAEETEKDETTPVAPERETGGAGFSVLIFPLASVLAFESVLALAPVSTFVFSLAPVLSF